ncbi:uncharacterized protein J4E87_009883 [Alternaria ethzedia]|uniref:uncharacterized protein n=1 Tax=Alternaria ethzedia TaxID=181014 RepID=UPI0020C53B53|nr:uncharacterized protein J4E87_009883 [Alternaria ethzedia]KAI4613416.1 hypothetical protein J4E87_009883 [Alternaria ethzedia]
MDVRTVQQERQAFLSQELDTQLMWEFKEPGVPALVARMQADHSQRRRDARAAAEARRRDARAVAEAPMRRAFELGMHFVMDFYDESQHNIPRAALDRALGQIQDPAQDGVFRMLNGLPRGVQVLRTPESEVFPPTSPIMDDYLFPEVIPETPTRRR